MDLKWFVWQTIRWGTLEVLVDVYVCLYLKFFNWIRPNQITFTYICRITLNERTSRNIYFTINKHERFFIRQKSQRQLESVCGLSHHFFLCTNYVDWNIFTLVPFGKRFRLFVCMKKTINICKLKTDNCWITNPKAISNNLCMKILPQDNRNSIVFHLSYLMLAKCMLITSQ